VPKDALNSHQFQSGFIALDAKEHNGQGEKVLHLEGGLPNGN
jgi:hypothetical protein